MPQWIIRHGKYFSQCHNCRREVEGVEEPGYGTRQTVVKFRCGCGSQWHKKKPTIDHAVRGGYENGLGEWIECDENGHMKPEIRAKIHNDNLGYGAVQVVKHLYIEQGLEFPRDMPEKFQIAYEALKSGASEEEARKKVAEYMRSHTK